MDLLTFIIIIVNVLIYGAYYFFACKYFDESSLRNLKENNDAGNRFENPELKNVRY